MKVFVAICEICLRTGERLGFVPKALLTGMFREIYIT